MSNPNCTKCIHYYITLDEKFPKGCRVFNIKGKTMPSVDVKRFTGHICPVFTRKENKKRTIISETNFIDTSA